MVIFFDDAINLAYVSDNTAFTCTM